MELTRYTSVEPFYQRAADFLVADEARHNLTLGLCAELQVDLHLYGEQQPYMAIVSDSGQVVATALMTPPYNLTLSSIAAPDALRVIANDLAGMGQTLPGVTGPDGVALRFAEQWAQLHSQRYALAMSLRIYQLTSVRPVAGAPGVLRRATLADRALTARWMGAFQDETEHEAHASPAAAEAATERWLTSHQRALYFWVDGEAVSMAGVTGPTPHGIRVGAVYTPPEYRKRGYASALVAAASQAQLDAGRRFCFLFTDLANPTSNHIYQEIGYEPVCDVDEYRFQDSLEGG